MPLLSRHKFPPGGFPYREPSINWVSPHDGLPFDMRVAQIQAVRMANPGAGLDPSFGACAAALDDYTCARLKNDPEWCAPTESPVMRAIEVARQPVPCSGCGHRRR